MDYVPQAARAKKLELQTRLEALQKDLAQLSDLKPGQLRSENAEIAQLNEARPQPRIHQLACCLWHGLPAWQCCTAPCG